LTFIVFIIKTDVHIHFQRIIIVITAIDINIKPNFNGFVDIVIGYMSYCI